MGDNYVGVHWSASPALLPNLNVHRIALHPEGTKPQAPNWADVAASILQRLEREQAHRPSDTLTRRRQKIG